MNKILYRATCKNGAQNKGSKKEVKDKMGESVSIYKVDVDVHQNIAAHFSVNSVPTLAVFKGGKLLWREPGVKPAAQLVQIISKL